MGNLLYSSIPAWVRTDEDRRAYSAVLNRHGRYAPELQDPLLAKSVYLDLLESRLSAHEPVAKRARRNVGSSGTPNMTKAAEYQRAISKALSRHIGSVRDVAPSNGPPFFTAQQQNAAAQSLVGPGRQHEKFLIPHFYHEMATNVLPLVDPNLAIINSEAFCWMPQNASDKLLKPDLFICPHYLVTYCEPYINAPDATLNYGTVTDKCLESVVATIDGKVLLTDDTAMDVVYYCRVVSAATDGVALGIAFDASNARLITARFGQLDGVLSLSLTAAGSRQMLIDFLSGHFCEWEVVPQILAHAGLNQLRRYHTTDVAAQRVSCLLGSGTFGRVFQVSKAGNNPINLALKVSLGSENRIKLLSEYDEIADLVPDLIGSAALGVCLGTLGEGLFDAKQRQVVATWYLMPLATPFRHHTEVTAVIGRALLRALSDIHSTGVSHGDSRYQNAVMQGGTALWVDFSESKRAYSDLKAEDIRMFLLSCERPISEDAIQAYCIANYASSVARHNAVIELWVDSCQ